MKEKKPRGIENFKASICAKCSFKYPGCEKRIVECVLAEICYYIRLNFIYNHIKPKDLAAIVSDLEKRVRKLESELR
jgi:hypothetical protein